MLDLLFGTGKRASGFGWWGHMWSSGRVRTQAGVEVDEELALTYGAYLSGVRLIAETEAGLPVRMVEHDEEGNVEPIHNDPLTHLLSLEPNPTMMALPFREGRTMHQVSWGNAFAEIETSRPTKTNPLGEVVALWPIHPCRVRPVRAGDADEKGRSLADQGFDYMVKNNEGSFVAMKATELLHIPGVLSEDGIWGKSIMAHARQEIGMGIAQQRYAATTFGNGGQPRAVVYGNGMKDKGARQNFREEWRQIHGSPDSGEIAILPIDAKYERITMSPADMALIDSRRFTGLELLRYMRIPPALCGYTEGATGGTLETLSMQFIMYGFLRWLRGWEQQVSIKLVPEAQRGTRKLEYLLHGLMRGDMQGRMNAYRTALMIGVMTINECRRLEGLNTIGPNGDKLYLPLNMQTVEQMAAGNVGRSGQPAPGRDGPGGDQDGAPAFGGDGDGSGDKPPRDSAAAFDAWMRKLGRLRGGELRTTLARLEASIARLEARNVLALPAPVERRAEDPYNRDEKGQFAPADETADAEDDEDEERSDRHQAELDAHDEAREQADKDLEKRHGKEEREQDKRHDREERDLGRQHEREDVGVEKARGKEDAGTEKDRDREDGRAPPDEAKQASRDREDDQRDSARSKEDDERAARQKQEREDLDAKHSSENKDMDEKHDREQEEHTAKWDAERDRLIDKHEAEANGDNGKGEGKDKGKSAAALARPVLVEALTRMYRKEANAAKRAATRPDFLDWLPTWQAKHTATVADALSPAAALLGFDAVAVAGQVLADSVRYLAHAYDTLTRDEFAARLAEWPALAELAATEILKGAAAPQETRNAA